MNNTECQSCVVCGNGNISFKSIVIKTTCDPMKLPNLNYVKFTNKAFNEST